MAIHWIVTSYAPGLRRRNVRQIVEAEPEKRHNTFVWEVEVVTAENR